VRFRATTSLAWVIGGLVACAAVADGRDRLTVQDLIHKGYQARRAGDLLVAGEALETAVLRSKTGPVRRALAAEVAEFYMAQDKGYRAVRLYRRLNYVRSEVDTLLEDGQYDAALAVARQVGYERGEAIALVQIGSSGKGDKRANSAKIKQALKILSSNEDLKRDKADLLFEVARKYGAAAKLYAEMGPDFDYREARCYDLAGKVSDSVQHYSDAKPRLTQDLRNAQDRLKRALPVWQNAKLGLVACERARRDVSLYSGKISEIFEQLAWCYYREGNAGCTKLVDKAIQYTERHRDTLLDRGKDKFGPKLVKYRKLRERLDALKQLQTGMKNKTL